MKDPDYGLEEYDLTSGPWKLAGANLTDVLVSENTMHYRNELRVESCSSQWHPFPSRNCPSPQAGSRSPTVLQPALTGFIKKSIFVSPFSTLHLQHEDDLVSAMDGRKLSD